MTRPRDELPRSLRRDDPQRTRRARPARRAPAAPEVSRLDVGSTLATLSRTITDLGWSPEDQTLRSRAELGGREREDDDGDDELALHGPGDRYEGVTMLGAGGMGRVDQVWDHDLMRALAVKRLLPEHADDRLALRQFLWEARVTAHLDHPNIVPVHDLGIDGQGQLYFTMKLVQGVSLEELIEALGRAEHAEVHELRPGPEDAALQAEHGAINRRVRLFLDLCQAINYAHERGVVHRDLKPANVMIGEFGEVLIMDWGLAQPLPGPAGEPLQALLPESLRSPRQRNASGTPRFMAPEQLRGAEIDARSDIYSLGVLLYELLALCSPYTAGELTRLLLQVADGEVVPLATVAPELSPSLAAIVERAMATEPAARYPSVRALMDDVEAFLDGLTPRAEQASLVRRFHRYYLEEHNPHAAHLRLVDVDLALLTGLVLGLLLATVIGAWLASLGAIATAALAVILVLVAYTPTRAVFRAMRSGKQRMDQLRLKDS